MRKKFKRFVVPLVLLFGIGAYIMTNSIVSATAVTPVPITKIQSKKQAVNQFGQNQVVLQGGWGSDVNQFGSSIPTEGERQGPAVFTLDKQENIYVLDQLNKRIQKFSDKGQFLSEIKLPTATADDLTIDTNGDIFVLDQFGKRQIYKLDSKGNVINTLPIGPEADNITNISAENGNLFLETGHDKVLQLIKGDQSFDTKSAPTVPGRKIKGLPEFVKAKFDQKISVDVINLENAPSLKTEIESARTIEYIVSLDTDQNGNIYVGGYIFDQAQDHKVNAAQFAVIAFDQKGNYIGEVDMPEAQYLFTKRPIVVSDSGNIYQMQTTKDRFEIVKWTLDK